MRREQAVAREQLAAELADADARGEERALRLEAAIAALEDRLRRVQALTARAYEGHEDWRGRLSEIRTAPGYEEAYEPEPLISVRIPTYNNAEVLCERALASLRAQTYQHWEALVVGDGCEDDTEERVAVIGDERIRFWNLPFRGPYPAQPRAFWQVAGVPPINAAVEAAAGSWIAPTNEDDEWEPDHLEVLLAAAREQRAEFAYGRMRVVIEGTEQATSIGRWPPEHGGLQLQASLYHAHLKPFRLDLNAHLADEPADWNFERRLWEAGARFTFVDRLVGTYFVPEDYPQRDHWLRLAALKPLGEGEHPPPA